MVTIVNYRQVMRDLRWSLGFWDAMHAVPIGSWCMPLVTGS